MKTAIKFAVIGAIISIATVLFGQTSPDPWHENDSHSVLWTTNAEKAVGERVTLYGGVFGFQTVSGSTNATVNFAVDPVEWRRSAPPLRAPYVVSTNLANVRFFQAEVGSDRAFELYLSTPKNCWVTGTVQRVVSITNSLQVGSFPGASQTYITRGPYLIQVGLKEDK